MCFYAQNLQDWGIFYESVDENFIIYNKRRSQRERSQEAHHHYAYLYFDDMRLLPFSHNRDKYYWCTIFTSAQHSSTRTLCDYLLLHLHQSNQISCTCSANSNLHMDCNLCVIIWLGLWLTAFSVCVANT